MNALGTYFKIRGSYLKARLIDEDGYFTIDRKVTVMIKKITRQAKLFYD